jgi:hypothetical protein
VRWALDKRMGTLARQPAPPPSGAPPGPLVAAAGTVSGAPAQFTPLPLEAAVGLAEVAGACLMLGLADGCYLPAALVDVLQGPTMVAGRTAAAHKAMRHWVNEVRAEERWGLGLGPADACGGPAGCGCMCPRILGR